MLMLVHATHIFSGITPKRINQENMMQPKHIAKNASKDAATISIDSEIVVIDGVLNMNPARATDETASPIAWAKRLGGPGTIL